jgi:hypothetical protein
VYCEALQLQQFVCCALCCCRLSAVKFVESGSKMCVGGVVVDDAWSSSRGFLLGACWCACIVYVRVLGSHACLH